MTGGMFAAAALPAMVLIAVSTGGVSATAGPIRAALSVFRGCRVMSHIYFPWTAPHNRRVVLRPA
ncbi:hypothetical protein SAMN03159371_06176 [Variovorax sp. NFACC28]|nr:hypothetical protein SAMN03159371_06176 [Variovorax sp. NFACC28]SEG95420.1 hypothetical protein SAMN03159365_06254 [Variovorax sp. NFACC29]SFD77037.1 hypothetical protein SAMN03159379_06213 [Variovorax sp. NFACC26]SFG91849.1 hypothetical protein SAMN03159447_05556 [Variovorax sp. NFACC27]